MIPLGDEAQVEARFEPFGDSANLDAKYPSIHLSPSSKENLFIQKSPSYELGTCPHLLSF
jgi:hypothetical protein